MGNWKVRADDHGWWYDDAAQATCCEYPAGAHERNETQQERIARQIGLEVGESKQVTIQGKTYNMIREQ